MLDHFQQSPNKLVASIPFQNNLVPTFSGWVGGGGRGASLPELIGMDWEIPEAIQTPIMIFFGRLGCQDALVCHKN